MRYVSILCLLIGLTLTACVGTQTTSRSVDESTGMPLSLEPSMDPQFNDIPVPQGFRLDLKGSFSHEAKSFRVAHLRYIGGDSMADTLAFYKEQMPVSNWKLVSAMGPGNSKTMDFEKDAEKCSVTVTIDGSTTTVEVRLR